MSNEIATYSMILSKLSLGQSGTECPTKTQILAINSLIVIDNASTYGANECVKIDDIRKKVETWNYYLTVSPTSMSFGAGGGSKTFTVSSYKRKVLDGVEQSGDTSVSLKSTTISGTGFSLSGTTVSASANEGTSNRTGTVTITQNESNKTATISLSQSGDTISSYGEWTISVSANPTSVSSSGGTSTITASAKRTVYWASGDVTEETGNPTLSTNLGSLSSSSSPSTLTLGENTSTSSRTATINATHGGKSATCTVTQSGATPSTTYTFSVNPYKVSVDSSGGSGSVTITSYKTVGSSTYDVDYSIDSSTLPSWASFNKSTSTFTIQSTTSTTGRTARVYFYQDESGKRDYAEITQTGYTQPADTYSLEIRKSDEEYSGKTSITFDNVPANTTGWSGDYAYRSRKNGEQFDQITFSSNVSWIVLNGSSYTVNYNTSTTPRQGIITLTQAESDLKCYVYINQLGKEPRKIIFTVEVADKLIYSKSWDEPTTATTVSAVLTPPSSWSSSDELRVNLIDSYFDGVWNNCHAVSTMNSYGKKDSISISKNSDSSITFTVEYWFKGTDYIFHMWPSENTSGTYSYEVGQYDLEVLSRYFKESHTFKIKSKPNWCDVYISSDKGGGKYGIVLTLSENTSIMSREGTIVFEQDNSGKTTSFKVTQEGKPTITVSNRIMISSADDKAVYLFIGEVPLQGSTAVQYLGMMTNLFTPWETKGGLPMNGGNAFAGDVVDVYERKDNRYVLLRNFELEIGEQTVQIQ